MLIHNDISEAINADTVTANKGSVWLSERLAFIVISRIIESCGAIHYYLTSYTSVKLRNELTSQPRAMPDGRQGRCDIKNTTVGTLRQLFECSRNVFNQRIGDDRKLIRFVAMMYEGSQKPFRKSSRTFQGSALF